MPPKRGAGRKVPVPVPEPDPEPRRLLRGRPSTREEITILSNVVKKNEKVSHQDNDSDLRVTCISIPVTEDDEEEVECKLCQLKTTLREFRIHNMQIHSNIATITTDPTVPGHKFYERRLKEFSKFSKAKTFKCPTIDCKSIYKSVLGLAFHLETCGKTPQEIEQCLVKCNQCDLKFSAYNLNTHKKTHHIAEDEESDGEAEIERRSSSSLGKRKSAIKAREIFQKEAENESENASKRKTKNTNKNEDDTEWSADAFDIEFSKGDIRSLKSKCKGLKKLSFTPGRSTVTPNKSDFTMNATQFMDSKRTPKKINHWDTVLTIKEDMFSEIKANRWEKMDKVVLEEYLPIQKKSIEFKTEVEIGSHPVSKDKQIIKDFRKLTWFKGEVIDDYEGNLVFNTGGPIYGMSWHPSGHLLAISTGNDFYEDLDYKKLNTTRKSSLQIYSHYYEKKIGPQAKKPTFVVNSLTPQLIISTDYGYITNIQWKNFWPECWDEFNSKEAKFKDTVEKDERVGFIACSFEDGTIKIYSLQVGDFMMKRNFLVDKSLKIPVHKKVPEICLKVDDLYLNTGQICKFDWHENNRFLIAGYASGVVAIFDLQTKSTLLREKVMQDGQQVTIFSPFWAFQAHVASVTGVHFDPIYPRYFVTASKDRFLKMWDMDMRKEIESKKVGLVVDTCWIRGWIHVAVAVDASISNHSSQFNFVRFYQFGHSQGRSNCAEFMDISSLSFHEGVTIQATENGKVTATYYDHFWRECDFDRNKKKQNVVNICKISLDSDSFEPLSEGQICQMDKSPRVIITFFKERLRSRVLKEPDIQYFEDYVRFLPYLRINKLNWSPAGKCFAVGYRSGLLTIVPATFQTLYG